MSYFEDRRSMLNQKKILIRNVQPPAECFQTFVRTYRKYKFLIKMEFSLSNLRIVAVRKHFIVLIAKMINCKANVK